MQFHHTTLDNGLEIVAEVKPEAQSAAVGFFVQTGSRDEAPSVAGVSHFLEHMAFKGDDRFSAEDVNRIFDEVGASYNASTSEEITIYYAAILPEYLNQTLELLTAMMRPSLRDSDFDMEKKVILEEIGMYEDMPAFSVYEQAMLRHFAGHPLGQSVLGSPESITALTSTQMKDYHSARYGAGNLVLAAAGNLEWEHLLELAEQHCGNWQRGIPGRDRSEARPGVSRSFKVRDEMHQQHVIQLAPAPSAQNPLRFAAEIAATIVGDDGAGRLYWDLVETGLAESCDLGFNDFDGSGAWMTYLCCQPEETASNLEQVSQIYADFNKSGPTAEEFEQARNKVASRVVLGSERPMGRLSALGNNWVYQRQYRSVEDDLQTLRNLTLRDVRTLLDAYPIAQNTTVGLGPYGG
ncbi:M16 family metallopeptidase [Planctomicrobium piriforme]|uniref:Predicted Zn-dependent peptidase n=1 Tax=Planctomicrobium piriforme TaxID=1576369 RepID=A0A1I3CBC5_9PLAN|nr:pitrilysin family protein [Planctomicrobium piriforme]SFH71850.1 Predicted Zn-dependent peptidase [Planctomicrobium piriforme]